MRLCSGPRSTPPFGPPKPEAGSRKDTSVPGSGARGALARTQRSSFRQKSCDCRASGAVTQRGSLSDGAARSAPTVFPFLPPKVSTSPVPFRSPHPRDAVSSSPRLTRPCRDAERPVRNGPVPPRGARRALASATCLTPPLSTPPSPRVFPSLTCPPFFPVPLPVQPVPDPYGESPFRSSPHPPRPPDDATIAFYSQFPLERASRKGGRTPPRRTARQSLPPLPRTHQGTGAVGLASEAATARERWGLRAVRALGTFRGCLRGAIPSPLAQP